MKHFQIEASKALLQCDQVSFQAETRRTNRIRGQTASSLRLSKPGVDRRHMPVASGSDEWGVELSQNLQFLQRHLSEPISHSLQFQPRINAFLIVFRHFNVPGILMLARRAKPHA